MAADDDVIARAKAGDEQAWRELYLLHAGRLVALMRLVGAGDGALDHEDAAAFAWLQAADKIADFHGSGSAFGGWLYTIARNQTARTRRRASHAGAAIPVGAVADLPVSAVLHESETEQLESVAERLAILPAKQRNVIALMDVLGYDTAATATALGMSTSAVRVNRHRGLARLRTAEARPKQRS